MVCCGSHCSVVCCGNHSAVVCCGSHSGCGKLFVVGCGTLCLQVAGQLIEPGTLITMATKDKKSLRQQFYTDDLTETIRCSVRDYCIDVDDNS